jgi:hypothetical protein
MDKRDDALPSSRVRSLSSIRSRADEDSVAQLRDVGGDRHLRGRVHARIAVVCRLTNQVRHTSEAFDLFRTSLATVDIVGSDNLLIGVPGEDGPDPVASADAVVMMFSPPGIGRVSDSGRARAGASMPTRGIR